MKRTTALLIITLLISSNYTWATSNNTTIDLADGTTTSGIGWTLANNVFTITDGANVNVTGSSNNNRIVVNGTATVTLNNVTITRPTGSNYGQAALTLNGGANVTLNLGGTNNLTGGWQSAGIQTTGATLIINGPGSLQARGGGQLSLPVEV
jgi:hypothetical protein